MLRFIEDKSRFIISHIALRKIISNYMHLPLDIIKLKYNEYNKRHLNNEIIYQIFFNLSHSNNKILIAITGVVGIGKTQILQRLQQDLRDENKV